MDRVFFGHHKCASQYVRDIFTRTADWLGMSMHTDNLFSVLPLDYHTREPLRTLLAERRTILETKSYDCLCLENADSDGLALVRQRGDYRGFHVIRDPRDVLISAYFSHRYSHPLYAEAGPWIRDFRQQLAGVASTEEGLLLELEFCAAYLNNIAAWDYHTPQIFETRYEALVTQPMETLRQAYEFMGIRVPMLGVASLATFVYDRRLWKRSHRPMPRRLSLPWLLLRRIVQQYSFVRKSGGRQPGQEDISHHYRKGVAGDWRNYFTPRVTAAFKERYGDMLIQLGYESSKDW
jgi:hypothetical protein